MLRSFYNFAVACLVIFSAIATLILFERDYFNRVDTQGIVGLLFIGFFAVFFFFYCAYLITRWGRNIRYGHVLSCLNQGFSHVHAAMRNPNPTPETIMKSVGKLCDSLATAFSVVTGTPCAIAVKLLSSKAGGDPGVRIRVVTMCRNSESEAQRDYPGDYHWLQDNTAFVSILENLSSARGRFFFSNRLPWYDGYRNTSFQAVGGAPQVANIPVWREWMRYWKWKLPYKSTVVAPICPGINTERKVDNLIGFLCVDSPRMGVFRERFDTEVMGGVADGIFNAVARYVELIERKADEPGR
jgi:hypothetical protein